MAKKSKPQEQDIITHFPKEEMFVKRILELMKQVDYKATVALTPFLAPNRQDIVFQLIGKRYDLASNGFYEQAEMKRIAIYDKTMMYGDDGEDEIDFGICQIVASYQSKFVQITHQDVLGALMGLGLQREQFGDIHVGENQIGIVIQKNQVQYISTNLSQIHQLSVQWTMRDEPVASNQSYVIQTCIVSSMRIDVLVADICRVSRSKSKEMITTGLVKVNHSYIENAEKMCHNMDIISIRGFGRFQIDEIQGMTKKGNYAVAIRQFK